MGMVASSIKGAAEHIANGHDLVTIELPAGREIVVRVAHDPDSNPRDWDSPAEHIAAFDRGEWSLCGLIVKVKDGTPGVQAVVSLWSIERGVNDDKAAEVEWFSGHLNDLITEAVSGLGVAHDRHAETVSLVLALTTDEQVYPCEVDGKTVWACCVSSIGPTCEHKRI